MSEASKKRFIDILKIIAFILSSIVTAYKTSQITTDDALATAGVVLK